MKMFSLSSLLFLFSAVAFAATTVTITEPSFFSTLDSAIVPTVSSEPDYTISVCRHPSINVVCSVKVSASGFGAKRVIIIKRENSGLTKNLAVKTFDSGGNARFSLQFKEVGVYNLIILAVDNSESILALGGVILHVEPSKSFFHSIQAQESLSSEEDNQD